MKCAFTIVQSRLKVCFNMCTHRQKLELKSIVAGPRMMAGKQVASIIKALDSNYVAISLMAELVSNECKSCPSVSKPIVSLTVLLPVPIAYLLVKSRVAYWHKIHLTHEDQCFRIIE